MLDGNLTQPNENNEIKILDYYKKCLELALIFKFSLHILTKDFDFGLRLSLLNCYMGHIT